MGGVYRVPLASRYGDEAVGQQSGLGTGWDQFGY